MVAARRDWTSSELGMIWDNCKRKAELSSSVRYISAEEKQKRKDSIYVSPALSSMFIRSPCERWSSLAWLHLKGDRVRQNADRKKEVSQKSS